jgi:competence protein ComEA
MIRTVIAVLLVVGLGVTASAAQESSRRASSSPPTSPSAAAAAPINLNTASIAQLETLPGIGRSTAERILEYRQKNGSFKKIEDLMNVRGVGEKSFLKLKPLITVAPAKGEAGQ